MFKRNLSNEKNLCPFSWIAQEKGCFFKQAVWEPVECIREKCKLWDSNKGDCVFNNLKNIKQQ